MPSLRRKIPSANALFVFESAARCGSFTKAAAEMGVTQPAVSRMLTLLENYLEVQLFKRNSGGAVLTEDGEILYQGVSQGFGAIDHALTEIQTRRSGTETVTLSVSTAFTTHWLMPRMHRLQRDLPNIDIRYQLMPSSLGGSLENVDLGMRFLTGAEVVEGAQLLLPEVLVLVCSPEYKARCFQNGFSESATYIGLSDHRTNWLDRFPIIGDRCKKLHEVEFTDYAVVLQAALLGQGFAVGWLNIVSNWLCHGSLVPLFPDRVVTGRLCHLMSSENRKMSQAASKVQEWIVHETRSDMALLNERFPDLKVMDIIQKFNIKID